MVFLLDWFRRPDGAVVSCVWSCQSHFRSLAGLAVITMISLTTVTILLQAIYLHINAGETSKMMLPQSPNETLRKLFTSSPKPQSMADKFINGYSFHTFGKAQTIVRFPSKQVIYRHHDQNATFKLFRHPNLFNSNFNGNISIHHISPFAYHKASNNNIYIMSAFDRSRFSYESAAFRDLDMHEATTLLTSGSRSGNKVIVTGWLAMAKFNNSLLCCLLKTDNTIVQYGNQHRLIWTQVQKQELLAAKIECPYPEAISREEVKGVTVTTPVENCKKKTFVELENSHRGTDGSVALCSKIAYGTISAQRLIEWLEIQRYIGVDKIIIYVYNLNKEAMAVLRHYTLDGLVDIIPFDYPKPENYRYVGQKAAMAFIDEQVVVFDCMERLWGYTYVSVMDADEIIYSRISPQNNLKHLLGRLMKRSPKAAGFTFRTELFIMDWNTKNLTSDEHLFWHSRHQNRTRPMVDRVKNFLVMDRIILGSVWTHNYTVKAGYTRYHVPASVATLKHYRPCREKWHCNIRRGYKDTSIANVVHEIKDILLEKYKILKVETGT